MNERYYAEIEARVKAATTGPWKHFQNDKMPDDVRVCLSDGNKCICCLALMGNSADASCIEQWNGDADFIAHSREDIPNLLADNRALQAENERLRKYAADKADENGKVMFQNATLRGGNERLRKERDALLNDIQLLDTRGCLCIYRDGGACTKTKRLCSFGSCSADPCKDYIWRDTCAENERLRKERNLLIKLIPHECCTCAHWDKSNGKPYSCKLGGCARFSHPEKWEYRGLYVENGGKDGL